MTADELRANEMKRTIIRHGDGDDDVLIHLARDLLQLRDLLNEWFPIEWFPIECVAPLESDNAAPEDTSRKPRRIENCNPGDIIRYDDTWYTVHDIGFRKAADGSLSLNIFMTPNTNPVHEPTGEDGE